MIGRYNGVNESPVFKNPHKLPAIIFFKNVGFEEPEEDKSSSNEQKTKQGKRIKEQIEF